MKEFTAAEGGGSTSHLFSKGRKLKNFKFVGLMDGGMGGGEGEGALGCLIPLSSYYSIGFYVHSSIYKPNRLSKWFNGVKFPRQTRVDKHALVRCGAVCL